MGDTFPRRQARTRRFTLGAPRGFSISADGSQVLFLRSRGGTDPVTCLWALDTRSGTERLVADPGDLVGSDADLALPPEERARRERSREQAGGIVGYATDGGRDGVPTVAAFTLSGVLYLADLTSDDVPRAVSTPPGVFDPRPAPNGDRVAYLSGGGLWLYDRATATSTALAEPESPSVRYGHADFVAAEEMDRMRGYWWSPSGDALLVARTDDASVQRWHIADPANPDRPSTEVAYPVAGSPNAVTELFVHHQSGTRVAVDWTGEYLAQVCWDDHDLLICVQPRDQRTITACSVDPYTGQVRPVATNTDPAWVDIVPGLPAHLSSGALVWSRDSDSGDAGYGVVTEVEPTGRGARRLLIDGEPVTPPSLRVRSVVDIDDDIVLFTASDDPTEVRLWTYRPGDGLSCLTPAAGVFGGRRRGGTTLVTAQTLDTDGVAVTVHPPSGPAVPIASLAEDPELPIRLSQVVAPQSGTAVRLRGPRTVVLLPSAYRAGESLPVLMDPYGGPHAQRVLSARAMYRTSQWLADQGFAVVVADGRGTPGRGPAYERAVLGDLANPALEDQVAALQLAAAAHPELDLQRVGIRGWSFGGYLAALAVLRRPEVFHAAVAGAPVTDWTLYDTHYTERYLGDPARDPAAYERSSLLTDAPKLRRPLLLIHGLADDNVVVAHTLRLSSALLSAGRPHSVLPLSGVTHMTPQEEVAENLLHLQVNFLHAALK